MKVDRQPVVRVLIASYTHCSPLIWISTHAHFGAFSPSSFLQSTRRCNIPQPRGHAARWVRDRRHGLCPSDIERASSPSGNNNSPVCLDAHVAFPAVNMATACFVVRRLYARRIQAKSRVLCPGDLAHRPSKSKYRQPCLPRLPLFVLPFLSSLFCSSVLHRAPLPHVKSLCLPSFVIGMRPIHMLVRRPGDS